MALQPFTGELDSETPSGTGLQSFTGKLDPPKRSAIGEITNQLKAGALVELPKMVGQAIEYTSDEGKTAFGIGKKFVNYGEEQEKRPDLQPDEANHNVITNTLASGARQIPQSVVPAALAGAALATLPETAIGAGVGLGISALAGALPAGMSQAQSTLEKAREKGVNEDDALKAARINGLIETGGETVGTYLGGKLFGFGAKKLAGKQTAETALNQISSPGIAKPFLKQLPETAIGEVGTEIAQNAGEAAVEKSYGIDNQSAYDAGKEAILPTLGMTALLAPFGLAGFAGHASSVRKNTEALSSEKTNPEVRQKIADNYAEQLAKIDPNAASLFRDNAGSAISNNQPLKVDESLFSQSVVASENNAASTSPSKSKVDPLNGSISRTANQAQTIQENIPASEILGDTNVSDTQSRSTGGVDSGAIETKPDNATGSPSTPAGQPDAIRSAADIFNTGLNQPIGSGDQPNGALTVKPNTTENATGEKLDKEWTAFTQESGSLGIPREQMPQIKAENRGAMVNFLKARGITHEQDHVPAGELKPTQLEFSKKKVNKAKLFRGGDRSILVSSDNHVLDGHHQWMAKLDKGEKVDVIRLNAPIAQLLDTVKEFPSATNASGESLVTEAKDSNEQGDTSLKSTNSNVRPLVEKLVKLRAAATQVGLGKRFEVALSAAKDLMDGKQVSPSKLKAQAGIFKSRDHNISDILMQLHDEASSSPEVLAAKENKSVLAKSLVKERMKLNLESDGLMQAIAKLGGLDSAQAKSEFGIDLADMKKHGAGILRSFKINGKSVDTMREQLLEQGYPVGETVADFGDSLADAMNGIDVLTPEGQEALARKKFEEYSSTQAELSDNEQKLLDDLIAKLTGKYGADVVAEIDASVAAGMEGQPMVEIERALIKKLQGELSGQNDAGNSKTSESAAGTDTESGSSQDDGRRSQPGSEKTPQQERRAQGENRVERRANPEQRKNVSDMNAEEMRAALLVDDLTGIGNRRAYDESVKKPYQVSIDADGLKWINDNLGHESGDILLKAIGEAIGRVTTDGYHISGDEFVVQAGTEIEAADVMKTVNELLAQAVVEGVNSTGDKVTLNGIGISYGIAKDLHDAEQKLQQHKQERETNGSRAGRGEQPANASIASKPSENNQDNATGSKTDLLGQDTSKQQALADAERAKDAKRNTGTDNQDNFTLTGSNSDADQAAANGAKPLFSRTNQPTFYSALSRAIDGIQTKKAPAVMWKGMIKNLAQNGVKPDEIEWTGVNDWLDLQQGNITKEQVQDYLNGNGVQISETELRDTKNFTYDEALKYIAELDLSSPEEVIESYGYADKKDYITLAQKQYSELSPDESITKYSSYTLPGGTNYKELLLTLPSKEITEDEYVALHRKKFPNADVLEGDLRRYYQNGIKLPDEKGVMQGKDTKPSTYRSSHFDQANILAHIRFDERTDADGKKVLFINEIQSDWGQDGKKKGFSNEKEQQRVSSEIKRVHGFTVDRLTSAAKLENAGVHPNLVNEWDKAFMKGGNTPTAPFVGKTDAWVSLALKRMMRYAAENGFDKVALINGQQAADLYDLSKTVSRVEYTNENRLLAYDKSKNLIFNHADVSEDKIQDFIGKEPAKKLLEQPELRDSNGGSISARKRTLIGDGLKVGGEGMRTFYDSIVPKVAKDVLKKLGGELSKTTINGNEKEVKPSWTSTESESKTNPTEQVSFTITPEMREQIMQGLPLFSKAGTSGGMAKTDVQEVVDTLSSKWTNAPQIVVVNDMSDASIPEVVRSENDRQLSQGAAGQPEGFFYKNKVYVVAGEMADASAVQRVIFHETLGHYGLQGTFGKSLDKVLDDIYMLRRPLVLSKAKQYGLNFTKQSDRRIAAEEVLAEMAQGNPEIGFVKRAIAAIRQWLRDNGFNLKLSDSDIVANYLLPARDFVKRGGKEQDLTGMVGAFIRQNESSNIIPNDALKNEVLLRSYNNKGINKIEDGKYLAGVFKKNNRGIFIVNGNVDRKVFGELIAESKERGLDTNKLYVFSNLATYTGSSITNLKLDEFTSPSSDGGNNDIRFSRSKIIGDNQRQRTPEQLASFKNLGRQIEVPTAKERVQNLWKDAGKKLAQGLADQFAPVKELDSKAYGLLRLSKGASGAFETLLNGGQLKLSDGVYNFDDSKRGGVVERLLTPLQGEADDFLWYVAANRAERLSKEDREHLFTPADITAMKSLADGTTPYQYILQHGQNKGNTTNNRAEIYADSLKTFNEFNKNTLDMAEQSGLIDGEARKVWESQFYVPFYRVDEDENLRGMNVKSGVVRQQAFKKLKGGAGKLNSDLLENTLMNWSHLLDAAAKNRAASATIESAEKVGIAEHVEAGTKNAVWVMKNGDKQHYVVSDPYVMTALTALEYAGMKSPLMNVMSSFKHALTVGVTASPIFKVRNLIRDSLQSIAVSGLSYNVPGNIKKGFELTKPKSDAYFRLLAGGGTIHFATMYEGSEARRVRSLVESGVDSSTILDNESKFQSFYKHAIDPSIAAYNELGNRGEAINRASLYDQLIKQGVSHADATLQARDLLDFSMSGSFNSVRFLTQVVPFMNARIQGLYKLGKAAKEDPRKFGMVLGAAALFSIALMLANADDDDWKKREDWDRDNYWWFKLGDVAYRIPKPFEIGAMASLAERGVELFTSDEMTGERFSKRLFALLSDNLSMNPVPQLVKPIIDLYANKDSFSGRPIETLGMERLLPEYRFNQYSSMAARGISTVGNKLTAENFLSPVQIDHLIQGYFSWLGTFVVSSADLLARPATNQPTSPSPDYLKAATGGLIRNLPEAQSRYVSQMYDQAKVLEQAYGTYRSLLKQGDVEGAKEFKAENLDKLREYKKVEHVKRLQATLNERIKMISRSTGLSSDEKRDKIDAIKVQQDRIARQLV